MLARWAFSCSRAYILGCASFLPFLLWNCYRTARHLHPQSGLPSRLYGWYVSNDILPIISIEEKKGEGGFVLHTYFNNGRNR